jgi:hypothetical protein
MTPKQKAKELADQYYDYSDGQYQCALIAVDEILKVTTFHRLTAETEYWKEVKTELELL